MDMAMFTGRVSVEELKHERPRYYEELVESGRLEERLVHEAPKELRFWGAVFGTIALVIGFSLVLFIIWSMVFGYRETEVPESGLSWNVNSVRVLGICQRLFSTENCGPVEPQNRGELRALLLSVNDHVRR